MTDRYKQSLEWAKLEEERNKGLERLKQELEREQNERVETPVAEEKPRWFARWRK